MNQNFSMTFKIHTSTDTRQEVSILHCSDKTKNMGHFLAWEKTGFNNLSTSRTVIHNTRWLRSSKEKGLSYHKFQKLTEESIAFNMLIMLMIVEKNNRGINTCIHHNVNKISSTTECSPLAESSPSSHIIGFCLCTATASWLLGSLSATCSGIWLVNFNCLRLQHRVKTYVKYM